MVEEGVGTTATALPPKLCAGDVVYFPGVIGVDGGVESRVDELRSSAGGDESSSGEKRDRIWLAQ